MQIVKNYDIILRKFLNVVRWLTMSKPINKIDQILLKKRLECRIGNDVASGRVGGAAVAVCQDGNLLYENRFGTQSPLSKEPLRKDALFRIASMTKPITAVAVLKLIEAGKLSLDDPVSKYLPNYRSLPIVKETNGLLTVEKEASAALTVLHLLTHTSGIGGGAIGSRQLSNMSVQQKASLSESVAYYARMGIQFEPGSTVLYSGVPAFDVLTAIVEQISETDYESFLKQHIFEPCRMTDTTFVPTTEQGERLIGMHDYVNEMGCVGKTNPGCVFEDFPITHPLGGAGLVSSLSDYMNFANMLLGGGCFDGNRVLSPASISTMSTPHVSEEIQPRNQRWGLAVKVVTDPSYPYLPLGAYGWSGAYGTHFWVDPTNRITAVYMKNSQYDGGGGATTNLHFEEDVYLSIKNNKIF